MVGVDGRTCTTCRAVRGLDAAGGYGGDAQNCQYTNGKWTNSGERGLGASFFDSGLQAPGR